MDLAVLEEVGLTQGEARVYLALTRLGSATTGPIADESGVSRSKIYGVLDKLARKGLVSFILKEKTRHYQAEDPVKLKQYLDEREKEFQIQRREIDALIPQLVAQKRSAKQIEAQIYKGFKGIQSVIEHFHAKLKQGEESLWFGVPAYQEEKYHRFWQRDQKQRISERWSVRIMFNQDTDASILEDRNSFKGCDARYMPVDVKTPAWIATYKDVTVIGLQSEELAIEIINEKIAESFRDYFEEFWKSSKPLKK